MTVAGFFLPNLEVGGAEMSMIRVLRHLDRSRVRPVLLLLNRKGALLEAVPADVPVVDLGRTRRLFLPRAALRLGSALREHAVDVLLSAIEVPTLLSLLTRPLLPRATRVGHIEQSVPSRQLPEKTPLLPLHRRLWRRLDFAIAVSRAAAQDLRRNFAVRDVHIIPNPIELEELRRDGPAPHPWLDDGVPCIVSLGRLDRQKGHDVLIEAFRRVRERTRARLLIFGDGPMKLQAGEDVALPGRISAVAPALRRATVFALASRVEGFPLAVAEAMACGAPVVATRVGTEELVRDGENGLLVPPEDPEAMAGALLRLLESRELRKRLADRARLDVAAFDAPAVARQYEQVIASACRKRG